MGRKAVRSTSRSRSPTPVAHGFLGPHGYPAGVQCRQIRENLLRYREANCQLMVPECESGADLLVKRGPCLGDMFHMTLRPLAERFDSVPQRPAQLGQLVVHTRRNCRELRSFHQASRSNPRSVRVSILCEMPPTIRLISLKRFGPLPSSTMIRTLHLSPTRASTELTARQSSLARLGSSTATYMCSSTKFVPSCASFAAVTNLV